jgi:hypothetical protein
MSQVDPEYLDRLQTALKPVEYAPQPIQQIPDDADYSQVTQEVNQTKQELARLRKENADNRNFIELQQDQVAEAAYPQLKTDKFFEQKVSEKKLIARVLGIPKTTLQIAKEVDAEIRKRDDQLTVQVAQSTRQQMIESQAAIAEPKSTSSGGRSAATDEGLKNRVRKGDVSATTELAKGLIADLEF